jgi:hypothetical protein
VPIWKRLWELLKMKSPATNSKNNLKTFCFLIGLITIGLFLACNSSEGKGSNVTEPDTNTPEIVEGFLCSGIFEDKPVGIDNDFFVDDIIYIWLSWQNVIGTHEVSIIWVDPNDKLIETKNQFKSERGTMTTYFWLDTTTSAAPGKWLAEVYLDGLFVRSYAFWLNSAGL